MHAESSGAQCVSTPCLPLFPLSPPTRDPGLGSLGWRHQGSRSAGASAVWRVCLQTMGCGLGSAPWRPVQSRGSESTLTAPAPAVREGRGGVRQGGAATPRARARWGRRQGAARGPRSLRLLRAGAAPQQQPVIGPALAWRAGRTHVAAAGWGGCDSAGGRLAPPWERACAGLWICRCLAWVCACVWLRVCIGVRGEWWCPSRGMLGLWPVGVCT